MGNKAITAEALTKYYGKARGIDGLDLEVETGDFFGFIGLYTHDNFSLISYFKWINT